MPVFKVTIASILLMSVALLSGVSADGPHVSPGLADMRGLKTLTQHSIVLVENKNNTPNDKEKTMAGSAAKGSEPETGPAADDKKKSSNTKSKPLRPFVPSEKIPGEQAVDFPVDI